MSGHVKTDKVTLEQDGINRLRPTTSSRISHLANPTLCRRLCDFKKDEIALEIDDGSNYMVPFVQSVADRS